MLSLSRHCTNRYTYVFRVCIGAAGRRRRRLPVLSCFVCLALSSMHVSALLLTFAAIARGTGEPPKAEAVYGFLSGKLRPLSNNSSYCHLTIS